MSMASPEALVSETPWSKIWSPKAPSFLALRIAAMEIAETEAPVSYKALIGGADERLENAILTK